MLPLVIEKDNAVKNTYSHFSSTTAFPFTMSIFEFTITITLCTFGSYITFPINIRIFPIKLKTINN